MKPKRRGPWADFLFRLTHEKPLGIIGGVIVLMLLFCGIFADLLAPYQIDEIDILDRFAPFSMDHMLGADQLGRDILSRLIHGARVSMVVGLAATAATVMVAGVIGVPSGYSGVQAGHSGPETRRRLDSLSIHAHSADRNVHSGTRNASDRARHRHTERHRLVESGKKRGNRDKGERLLPCRATPSAAPTRVR